jgi:hypothetical protein
MNIERVIHPNEVLDPILRGLTVQGEGNLNQALDQYFERLQRVYR